MRKKKGYKFKNKTEYVFTNVTPIDVTINDSKLIQKKMQSIINKTETKQTFIFLIIMEKHTQLKRLSMK